MAHTPGDSSLLPACISLELKQFFFSLPSFGVKHSARGDVISLLSKKCLLLLCFDFLNRGGVLSPVRKQNSSVQQSLFGGECLVEAVKQFFNYFYCFFAWRSAHAARTDSLKNACPRGFSKQLMWLSACEQRLKRLCEAACAWHTVIHVEGSEVWQSHDSAVSNVCM